VILVLCISLLSFSLEKQQNIKGTELLLAIVLGDFIRGNIVRCVCVCVCVCVYTYIYIHTCMHTYIHVCVCVMCVCMLSWLCRWSKGDRLKPCRFPLFGFTSHIEFKFCPPQSHENTQPLRDCISLGDPFLSIEIQRSWGEKFLCLYRCCRQRRL
jgi:hypothetical protein